MSTEDMEVVDNLPDPEEELPELKVYCHNNLFYWWPVWACGFIMAIVSFSAGTHVETAKLSEHIHPSANPGVIFTLVLLLVILLTNFAFRGAASLGAVAFILIMTMALALMGLWDEIFSSFSYLSVHMNVGFYLFFSTLLFLLWVYAVFLHIRFRYYRIRPGQISKMVLIGEGEKNYDTRGAMLEKVREDPFRHWILGLGSGDIKISTTGARSEEIYLKNVLFVDRKTRLIRKLTSVQPDDLVED